MDDSRLDPPPTLNALPSPWINEAVKAVKRGPRHALAYANVLEAMFPGPFDGELRADALTIAEWLRARTKK